MNKMRQWSMLTAVAVIVVMAAGWFLAVSPQRHKATDLQSQAAQQQSANASLQAQVAMLEQQKKGLPAQQRLLAKIGTQIPDNPALPTLIRQLSTAATAAGVDLQSMAPAQPTPVVAAVPAATTTTTTSSSASAAPTLNQIQIQLTVKGSYFNLETWFASVEKLTRAMMVTQWTIQPSTTGSSAASASSTSASGAAASEDPPGTLIANMTAVVFESPRVATPTTVSPAAAAPAPAS